MLHVLLYEAYSGRATGHLRYLLDLARHGKENGIHLEVAAPRDFPLLDEVRHLGVPCHVVAASGRLMRYGGVTLREGGAARLLTGVALGPYWLRMRSLFRAMRPDVLLANSLRSIVLAGPAARVADVPVVWYMTGDVESVALGRWGFRVAKRVVFQSHLTVDRRLASEPRLAEKIRIVPNGVDVHRIEEIRDAGSPDLVKGDGEIWIATVGTLSPEKGLDTLLDAFERCARRDARLRLMVVGEAALDRHQEFALAMKERVQRTGMAGVVRFLGWRDDVPAVLHASDVMVHASLTEGVPKSVIEAMVVGRPVVATAVGGTGDVILDGVNGFLVPPGQAEPLAARLMDLVGNPTLCRAMGAKGAELGSRQTIEANIQKLGAVLSDAARKTRPHS